MTKTFLRASALMLAATTLATTMQAAAVYRRTDPITIPYSFQLQKKTLPAGEYRLVQEFGSQIATLTNTKTRDRVHVLRPDWQRKDGKALFTFTPTAEGHQLRIY